MATDKPATKSEPASSAPTGKPVAAPATPVKAEAKAAEPVKVPVPAAPKAEAAKPEPVKTAPKPAEPVKAEAPKRAKPVKTKAAKQVKPAKPEAPKAATPAKNKVAAAKPAAKQETAAAPAKTPAAAVPAAVVAAEIVDIETVLAYPRDTMAIFSEISSEAAEAAVGLNETFAGYVAMSFDLGFKHVEAVTGSRSFEDIYAANSGLFEAEFDAWLASSIATIEAGTRFVDKLSAPVEARLKKYSDEMLERMAG